jgi:hypothetical protein
MKITGLDGREYSWNLIKYKAREKCSKLHARARLVLTNEFPYDTIYEELTLPGSKDERQTKTLSADFCIPSRNLMVEVQGEQHYKFNPHFFDNKLAFFRAQARDRLKQEWCELNNFMLVQLPYNESDEQWLERIRGRI